MSVLEDIQKEILESSDREIEDEYKMSLSGELVIILTRLIFIIIVSFGFYYGLAYLIVYDSYSWESYRETVLQFSFWMGILSVFLISIRGQVGSLLFQASAIRTAWTGKKMEPGAFQTFQNWVFGIKWDTVFFYGSVSVFIYTYFFTN